MGRETAPAPAPPAPAPPPGAATAPVARLIATAAAVVLGLGVLVVVRAQLAGPVRVASDSMTPTLLPGDVVLVDRRGLDLDEVRRGDLVTFRSPVDGAQTLKRVVGLPEDTVVILDAVLHVNGRPVGEPHVDFREWDGTFTAQVTVPQDSVYVLGDNRFDSIDSRDFGAVPAADLDGRVLVRLWPPVRLGAAAPAPPVP